MAEALARTYGSDVMVSSSAGLTPAGFTVPETRFVLMERNISLGEHLPRHFRDVDLTKIDVLVNMSGRKLPEVSHPKLRVEEWQVADPIGLSSDVFRTVCDDIEMRVMNLILRMRTGKFDLSATTP